MTRLTIRRFDVIRTANIVAALYAVIVLVVGLIIIVPLALFAAVSLSADGGGAFAGGMAAALAFTVLGLLFYAVIGWISTALVCVLYNLVAGRMGGVRIEVDVEGPSWGSPVPPAAWGYPGYAPPESAPPGGPPQPPPGWGHR